MADACRTFDAVKSSGETIPSMDRIIRNSSTKTNSATAPQNALEEIIRPENLISKMQQKEALKRRVVLAK